MRDVFALYIETILKREKYLWYDPLHFTHLFFIQCYASETGPRGYIWIEFIPTNNISL